MEAAADSERAHGYGEAEAPSSIGNGPTTIWSLAVFLSHLGMFISDRGWWLSSNGNGDGPRNSEEK
jgi:hypothetical protein